MLIEFSVENFKCFKEKVTFSMVADSELRKFDPDKVDSKDQLLNVAAIYGANASGKSSLIDAMLFLKNLVSTRLGYLENLRDTVDIYYKLDATYQVKPTIFNLIFLINDEQYTYHLSLSLYDLIILKESLHVGVELNEPLFERSKNDIQLSSINLESQEDKIRLEIYKEQTREDLTFLAVAANLNFKIIQDVIRWIGLSLNIILKNNRDDYLGVSGDSTYNKLKDDPQLAKKLLNYFKMADISIEDISIQKGQLLFWHSALDAQQREVKIPFHHLEESLGTEQYFSLLGFIDATLQAGSLLFVDELELHLHPLLTKAIIKLFSNPETNPNKAQLVFTTHTTELLVRDDFNLDQIWFVDRKGTPKASELYSLLEFGDMPENIEDDPELIKRRYLQGRFGAIPHIAGITEL